MPAPTTRRLTTAAGLEIREAADGVTVEGYASTVEQGYDMGWYTETVRAGAFTKTLSEKPDVRYLINHDGLPLARTTSGTLELSQDSTGLHSRARLDPSDPDVQRLLPKMRRGDVNQMSFGFRVVRQDWNEDYSERSLTELSLANGDVSVVTYPANPNTTANVRARQVLDADPARIRATYAAIVEERAGKTLSAATEKSLRLILESLQTIDESSDDAIATLADLLGDDPAADDPDTDGAEAEAAGRSGRHPSIVRERLRIAGVRL